MTGGSKIWTVRGIPAELQSAVSGAAKAARLTLGEWTAAALTNALASEGRAEAVSARDDEAMAARVATVEGRLTVVERRLEGLDSRSEGTQFRVDGLEHRAEGVEGRIATLLQRLEGFERGRAARAEAVPESLPYGDEGREERLGPFTRGIGSRKRLTTSGEEELQRLLAAGVDDAAIAARLGIHKRIVWARR